MSESEAPQAIRDKVAAQFTGKAGAYAQSAVHADPNALKAIADLVNVGPSDVVLDVATGSGNVAFTLATTAKLVVALDITRTMLEHVAGQAKPNVVAVQAAAEAIPLESGSVDLLTVRLAPHHFADLPRFISEAARVVRLGGRFLVIDTTVPEDDELDEQINRLEWLRDPSHVRNYRASEWSRLLAECGFQTESVEVGGLEGGVRLEVHDWMNRIGTPEDHRPDVLEIMSNPSLSLREALDIRSEGDTVTFDLPRVTLLAKRVS